jgi:4-amino-4-deoxy-L-arabinose transferase-like glycosyltransferase
MVPTRASLSLIAATTLVVRVALMVILQSWEFPHEWAYGHEMGRMGRWLAEGQGFSLDGETPTAKFPLVYAGVVAGAFSVFGVYSKAAAIGLFLFQSVCASLTAICLVVLGNHLLGRTAGLIAGFAWAFSPSSIFRSVSRIWYSELAVMLLLLAITIAATAKGSPTVRRSALLGGLSGLLVLTDSTMVLYLVLLLLWMLFARGVKLPRFIASVIVWGLAAGVVVSPWALRNWFVLGSPQIVKSNFGLELFLGNNPFSSGTTKQEEQAFAALDQEEYAYYRAQPERVYYRYLQDKALEWIRAHLASDVPAIRGLRKPISNISRRLRRSTSSESARGWTMGDPPRPGNRHSLPL